MAKALSSLKQEIEQFQDEAGPKNTVKDAAIEFTDSYDEKKIIAVTEATIADSPSLALSNCDANFPNLVLKFSATLDVNIEGQFTEYSSSLIKNPKVGGEFQVRLKRLWCQGNVGLSVDVERRKFVVENLDCELDFPDSNIDYSMKSDGASYKGYFEISCYLEDIWPDLFRVLTFMLKRRFQGAFAKYSVEELAPEANLERLRNHSGPNTFMDEVLRAATDSLKELISGVPIINYTRYLHISHEYPEGIRRFILRDVSLKEPSALVRRNNVNTWEDSGDVTLTCSVVLDALRFYVGKLVIEKDGEKDEDSEDDDEKDEEKDEEVDDVEEKHVGSLEMLVKMSQIKEEGVEEKQWEVAVFLKGVSCDPYLKDFVDNKLFGVLQSCIVEAFEEAVKGADTKLLMVV